MVKTAWVVLVLMWLVSLPVLSYVRARQWTDETALWRGSQWWSPAKLRPTVELGRMHLLSGRVPLAEQEFRHAIYLWEQGRPGFEQVGCEIARENLVQALTQQAKYAEAEQWSRYTCVRP